MNDNLVIKFWDVQHGNATHITTPNNKVVVIDLGDADSMIGPGSRFSPLRYLRHVEEVTAIDQLIITHPHRDHIDDIENLDAFTVRTMSRPKWLTESEIRQGNKPEDGSKISQYVALSNRFNALVPADTDITTPANWGGVVFKMFWSYDVPRANLNNHSLVTFVSYAGLKVLLPGDNESPSWKALLQQPAFVQELKGVNLLLAPHHGREAGFCSEIFDAGLAPWITVISDDQSGSTSVTDKYHARTSGWKVQNADGAMEERRCVTTRCDGEIVVTIGRESTGSFLNVRISK